jgi:hypothetical protein
MKCKFGNGKYAYLDALILKKFKSSNKAFSNLFYFVVKKILNDWY